MKITSVAAAFLQWLQDFCNISGIYVGGQKLKETPQTCICKLYQIDKEVAILPLVAK